MKIISFLITNRINEKILMSNIDEICNILNYYAYAVVTIQTTSEIGQTIHKVRKYKKLLQAFLVSLSKSNAQ